MASSRVFGDIFLSVFGMCLFVTPMKANFDVKIRINEDGHISDISELPKCSKGTIQLLSYNYEFECGSNPCTNIPDERLSDLAVISVYEMCSLKSTCTYQDSSFVASQHNFQSFLKISYKCLGLFDYFVDICENTTIATVKTIHLTNHGSAKQFKECACSISGRFLLTLADVRLRSAVYHGQCSPAELIVNHKSYRCDRISNKSRSVYNKTVDGVLTDEIIKFRTNSEDEGPEMVYLTAKAEGGNTTEVSCIHYPRIDSLTTMDTMQEDEIPPRLNKYNKETEQNISAAPQSVAMVAVGVGITLAIIIVLVVVFLLRRRRQQRDPDPDQRLDQETQLIQSQPAQQQGNKSCGEYSFARDYETTFTGGVGDHVDGVECLNECNVRARNKLLESKRDFSRKATSTLGRLKNYVSKTPKQETPVYSYATPEPPLRNAQETSNDEFANERTNQSSAASNGQIGRSYFKLEPQQTTESGSRSGATTDTISNTKVSSKKKKKGEHHIDTCEDDVSASRCKDAEVYDVAHYNMPLVDATKLDNFKEHKTVPSGPSTNVSGYKLTNGHNVYANERSTIQSGADKYEPIAMSRSVVPQANDSHKSKSQGVLDKILSIFKSSEQKPANRTTKILSRNVEEIEDGSLSLVENQISSKSKIDSIVESQGKTGDNKFDYANNQELDHSDPSNDHFDGSNASKTKGFFSQKKLKVQTKAQSLPSKAVLVKETIDSLQSTKESQSAVLPLKQVSPEADEDHHDKLTTDNVVPTHPNYDKVSATIRRLTFKKYKT